MKCPNCNNEIKDTSQFCTYCGSKVHLRTIADLTKNAVFESNEIEERAERQPDEAKAIYTPYTTHASNAKRCKICGGEIDPITKVCMNCQKSYANSFMTSKIGKTDSAGRTGKTGYIVALSIAAVLLIVSGVFSIIKNNELNDAYARIDSLQTRVSQLQTRMNDYQGKASFVDAHIALVVEGDDIYYHTYDCSVYQTCESFWIYGINDAEYYGFEPCPECH